MKPRATKIERMRAARRDPERRFRLIRLFSAEHNLQRFRAYVKALGRHPECVAFSRRLRPKQRAKAALGIARAGAAS